MKIKIIYNPSSGKSRGIKKIKTITNLLLSRGHLVQRIATEKEFDTFKETQKAIDDKFDLLIVAGGDGTVNEAAGALASKDSKIPLGIFQFGSVNDFAKHLNLPNDPEEFVQLIDNWNYITIDLGKANDNYFVNVAAGGILTNVAHDTPRELKAVLGKNAYYIHGIKELSEKGLKTEKLLIETDQFTLEDEFYLFLISNSPSVGGFDKFLPHAEIQDGLLDCIFIKKSNFPNTMETFVQVLQGKHIENDSVLYFKTQNIKISSLEKKEIEYDIDGELGGTLPLHVEAIPKKINIIINKKH